MWYVCHGDKPLYERFKSKYWDNRRSRINRALHAKVFDPLFYVNSKLILNINFFQKDE